MKTKKKEYFIKKHPNAYRRLLRIRPIINALKKLYWILIILIISGITIGLYFILSNDIRDIICFIFVPIISAVVTPLIINVINKTVIFFMFFSVKKCVTDRQRTEKRIAHSCNTVPNIA